MPRKDPKQAKRDARSARRRSQTRDEILDTAAEIIVRDGLTAFTLAAVAEELGLTNPALYYYFKSKEALIGELCLREWLGCATAVEEAIAGVDSGPEAVEALIRSVFARYRSRLEIFLLIHSRVLEIQDVEAAPEFLQRVRPVNDMLYRRAAELIAADQKRGAFPTARNPRRFVFTAHTAVIGLLNMIAISSAVNDPLVHRDDDLIDDLCLTFRTAAGGAS